MFTPAAIIVMSVTRSPLAPMLMAESESDPPSVVLGSIVVVSSVGPGVVVGAGAVVVSPVFTVVSAGLAVVVAGGVSSDMN